MCAGTLSRQTHQAQILHAHATLIMMEPPQQHSGAVIKRMHQFAQQVSTCISQTESTKSTLPQNLSHRKGVK